MYKAQNRNPHKETTVLLSKKRIQLKWTTISNGGEKNSLFWAMA